MIQLPSENPMYDNTRLDLGIDPQDLNDHDSRVRAIVAKYPSKIIDSRGEFKPWKPKGRK